MDRESLSSQSAKILRNITFGYYPEKLDISTEEITIKSLSDIEEKVADINKHKLVSNDWLYAPFETRIFGLPHTHELTHKNSDSSEHLEFLIWTLSFFVGMRLTTTKAGFLDSTPIKKRKLIDFCIFDRENLSLKNSINYADIFWTKYKDNKKMTRRICAIIHALFMAQNPKSLEFETFLMLYTALDASYACLKEINNAGTKSHAQRISWMCEQLKTQTPKWAIFSNKKSELSEIRNNSIHEGLFFYQPLGFSIYGNDKTISKYGENTLLEMQSLICRILVYLLVGENDYIKTPVNTRNIYDLSISE